MHSIATLFMFMTIGGLFSWLESFGEPTASTRPPVYKNFRIRDKHGFRIEIRDQGNGTYKLYCLQHPSIPAGYSRNVNDCHLYNNKEICITAGKEPRTFDKAVAIAQFFCHGFSTYVDTGRFPNKSAKVNV